MKYFISFLFCFSFLPLIYSQGPTSQTTSKQQDSKPEYALVIHGGAGTIRESEMTKEKYTNYYNALDTALMIGEKILKQGGSSLDAIEATINFMENSPLFNSGRGAVFTHYGTNEMDASIMDGSARNAGAVGGVTNVKHPISAARKVMEDSPHVLLTGKGAETFAKDMDLEIVDPEYFKTKDNWDRLQKILIEEKSKGSIIPKADDKFGTVGAVALDKNGNIAAGTSTGGMTNKKWNRLGDSPVIGAGTFADNKQCGVSCTGHGEYFIKYAVAYDMVARMEYLGEDIETAGNAIIHQKLKDIEALGGLIALDKDGNITMPFNTEGMYRGWIKPNQKEILMYKSK